MYSTPRIRRTRVKTKESKIIRKLQKTGCSADCHTPDTLHVGSEKKGKAGFKRKIVETLFSHCTRGQGHPSHWARGQLLLGGFVSEMQLIRFQNTYRGRLVAFFWRLELMPFCLFKKNYMRYFVKEKKFWKLDWPCVRGFEF